MRMIIITGAAKTGKSFVARAIRQANLLGAYIVYEVDSLASAVDAYTTSQNWGFTPIFVCAPDFVLCAADLLLGIKPEHMPEGGGFTELPLHIHLENGWEK